MDRYLSFHRFGKKKSIFSSLICCYSTDSYPQLFKHAALTMRKEGKYF